MPGVFQCESCRRKAELAKRREAPKPKPKLCAKCGRDVSKEVGALRQGDYVCLQCRKDPLQVLQLLLKRAREGDRNVQQIAGYTIVKELGRGGMGVVYLARHDRSGEQVALKVMLPKVAANERSKANFLREVELTKALNHPNIVGFRDSGFASGTFFLTLEFCARGSVDRLMQRRGGCLPVDEAMPIVFGVLDGLEYAHQAHIPKVVMKDGTTAEAHGLVDRDLSPHNILLSGDGGRSLAKVSDFGLSKAFDAAGLSQGTRTGEVAGKPWFMPRQQVVNYKYSKPDVDVWAAAACLYNMLTGAIPRDFQRGMDPWRVVLQTDPVPILRRNPALPNKLARVIDQALVEKPRIGFQSASEFKQALQGAR